MDEGGCDIRLAEEEAEEAEFNQTRYNPRPVDESKHLHVVVAGKSGAGKSTLAYNIMGIPLPSSLSAGRITQKHVTKTVCVNNVFMSVTDTVGLEDAKQKKKALKDLHKHTNGKADLIIYCLPVSHSSKFDEGNPDIMKSLQEAYGNDIWKQCLLVLTFSNQIIDKLMMSNTDVHEATYKNYLKEHTTKFREQLKILKVKDINVREEFGFQTEALSDYETTIVAVPAGDGRKNIVFVDFKDPTEFVIPKSKLLQEPTKIDITDWREIIFIEMVRKCTRYGHDIAMSIGAGITGASHGLVGGALVGAGAGAITGLVAGPFGIAPGAVIGSVIGAIVVALGGGAAGTIFAQLRSKRKGR